MGAGLDGVALAVAPVAPAHEAAVGLGVVALGQDDAAGGAIVDIARLAGASIGLKNDVFLRDDLEVVVEDGVEVMEEGVHILGVQGIVTEVDVARVAANGVVVVDGIEHLGGGRPDTEDDILVHVEGVGGVAAGCLVIDARSQVVDAVESVAVAAPAPVEVVAPGGVGAIEDEGMAAGGVGTGVVDWLSGRELGVEQRAPGGIIVVVGVSISCTNVGRIFEEVPHGANDHVGIRTAAAYGAATVHHFDRHTTMVGEHADGLALVLQRCLVKEGGHQLPVIGRGAEVGRIGVAMVGVGMGVLAKGGIVPVFHDLRHGGGHATDNGAAVAVGVEGAVHVVGGALVPSCGEHHGYIGEKGGLGLRRRGGELLPLHRNAFRRDIPIFNRIGNLTVVAAEPVGQRRMEHLGERSIESIGQDWLDTVVGRDNDETVGTVGEDI